MANSTQAEPFYSAYINQDCKLASPITTGNQLVNVSDNCKQINALIDQINAPYTGSSTGERLSWLKNRQKLLLQRATVIQGALKDLGSTDTVDHTATDLRSVSGLVAGFTAAIPAIGPVIGLSIGIVGNLVGGIIDTTSTDTARKNEEIAHYKTDYAGLTSVLDQTNQEIDKLNLVNYLLWGGLFALLLIYLFKKKG